MFQALVQDRNRIVHHFLEHSDLTTTDGRREAEANLDALERRIDDVADVLRDWLRAVEALQGSVLAELHTTSLRDFVVEGIVPDEGVA